ncbi:MAG: penicillin-binding protein 1C [Deltaproteobacteria bacterium]|nr:penicillin-binding protein 1C [Deltaproteobacteria bacterium]MBW2533278.1 penicillin-binding protein 1C [Deltaproteobacteria bacterium]
MKRRRWIAKAAFALAWATVTSACAWHLYRTVAGEPQSRLRDEWHRSTAIVDRRGRLLRDEPSSLGVRGAPLRLEQVGARLVAATLVAEDQRFFEHGGVDGLAVLRAVGQNARHVRVVSGASTVTQQLVKLLDGGGRLGPRTLSVKLRESARAQNLEQVLGKATILEAYVNRLTYGRSLVGPDAAARGYFGVAPTQLSWAQAAYLAVLPRAPTYLDPYEHPERVRKRQQRLLADLRAHGVMTEADYERSRREVVTVVPLRHPFHARHFVLALQARGAAERAGTLRTTLDLDLQRDVAGQVASHLGTVADRRATNAAVLVVDNFSGEVLAYAGSAAFDDPDIAGQVDMVQARRQPGSTLKPFVYALGFEAGRSAHEPLADVATTFGDPSRGYAPANFDGIFRGPVSAREALAGSLNVPAVRVAADIGSARLLSRLRGLGLESLDGGSHTYGLSLALGSGEVTLRELTAAYAALARGGRSVELRTEVDGPEALGVPVEGRSVVAPAAAALVADSLSDPLARVRGLGGRLLADLGFPVAVKTGTSSGYRDAWCLGYTRERTVGVWVGNADGQAMAELTGGAGAGPLFAAVMRRAMADVAQRRPLWDDDLLEPASVCPLSGRPVGPACPQAVTRLVPSTAHRVGPGAGRGARHDEPCALHRHAARGAGTAGRAAPWRCDRTGRERIVVLGPEYGSWLSSQPLGAPGRDADGLPWLLAGTVAGCGEGPDGARAELQVDHPRPGSVMVLARGPGAAEQQIELRASLASAAGATRVDEVEFELDGELVARSRAPFAAYASVAPGGHVLRVRPTSAGLPVEPAQVRFSVR